MATTWTIAIDWGRNGNYTDTYDDVTSRAISANWFLGMRKADQDNNAKNTEQYSLCPSLYSTPCFCGKSCF
jgi:hypothetical protein